MVFLIELFQKWNLLSARHTPEGLVAKVGAGGLCVVVNTNEQEAFVVKICDCDMKAREMVVLQTMKNLKWAEIPYDKTIKTLHGDIVGEIVVSI